MDALAGA